MSQRALIVEDEQNIVDLLRSYLEREGFEVAEALDGNTALRKIETFRPDVVVLDWMLPGMDGMEVLARMRRFSEAYVVVLTARSEETDKIVGLSSGADDYVTKPFSPGELVARIRAMLRRPRGGASLGVPEPPEEPLRFGDLSIDLGSREVEVGGCPANLTALEFDLLTTLAGRPGYVFSRARLLERLWGEDYFGDDHVVDVHIANLRKKIEPDSAKPRYIQTVRGVGYRFSRGPWK
ncbi:Response regulators consisting of a CheY-like receiver domain and a winged-helix DNA-binding domain [Rubrobacter radiotolerans]|uniref:Response regulator transcription factor n=1 Tax=Rubrobacter radiotolerans TaxID=42256 RepID=A0A023X3K8_RUBRA|nr:response regulator transcription factor [Rubrobacter radiotolerans]AHY46634.1 Response regulators consisting of a CheY-like receiver domain and a winged-helix DNA-binding domain [Rubrobacter radiotolerans]MDX5894041.1 response regulator transcription factor [Rubrobacter radiotolerans]SMC05044.1 DNA-binding response regulator, OmpR family, contains REC and winged-helix (wHTH) domain [Rubrobacter radiotolerans DSM 5868]